MSPRSLRRAAERRQAKLARKLERAALDQTNQDQITLEPVEALPEAPESSLPSDPSPLAPAHESAIAPSEARLAANQANAQLSTGPKTTEGKAISSKNALKTGLTGRTVLLPGEDAERYAQHLTQWANNLKPEGDQERALVQAIADATWRLDRIPSLEFALYVRGAIEFASRVTATDPQERSALLQIETCIGYERHFRNLHLQESRLWRMRDKLIAELNQLQTARQQQKLAQLRTAAKLLEQSKAQRQPFQPADHGFEFSIGEIESFRASRPQPSAALRMQSGA